MNARILHLVGARPNFVKMAPLVAELRERAGLENLVAHTGQHYDAKMSDEIFGDLELPEPDFHLGVGSGSHGAQTARALSACEELIQDTQPDLLVVAGDVNSTLAGALAAAKLGVQVAHLEAGLRSFDWGMPEEINRVLTDRLSDVLLTHSPEAEPNLLREGIDPGRIHLVGNTMIDSLRRFEVAAGRARGVGALRPRARELRARDAAPPVQRRRPGPPRADRRRPGRPRGRRGRRLPGPPAHARVLRRRRPLGSACSTRASSCWSRSATSTSCRSSSAPARR